MFQLLRNFFRRKFKLRNQRRYKRMRADFLVKYQLQGKGETHITNIQDISAGGVRFWLDNTIPESVVLNVNIYIPPLERSVEALAQVLRVRRTKEGFLYSAAVSFLEIKKEDRDAINEFAESLSKDQGASFLIDHADIVVRKE